MRVDHVGHPMRPHPGTELRHSSTGPVNSTKQARTPNAGSVEAPAQDEGSQKEHVKGVIRLLEQGHFKGVADVRLRINFFEELSQRATARTVESLPGEAQTLVDSVNGKVDDLLAELEIDPASQEDIQGALNTFKDDVGNAVNTQVESGDLSLGTLSDALQAAFTNLLQRISDILQPPAEGPDDEATEGAPDEAAGGVPGDETGNDTGGDSESATGVQDPTPGITLPQGDDSAAGVTGDPAVENPLDPSPETADPVAPVTEPDASTDQEGTTPSLSVEDALAQLQTAFDDALSSLIQNLQSSLRLGEPSPPSGNGAAYDKFLAIYHDLLNGNAPEAPQDSEVNQTI